MGKRVIPSAGKLVTVIVTPGNGQAGVRNEPWLLLVLHLQRMQRWSVARSGRVIAVVVVVVVVVAVEAVALTRATGPWLVGHLVAFAWSTCLCRGEVEVVGGC
jgi:hypothetical protein